MSSQRGFTLIELMIVVAIIAIIAAVALPSLAESRRSANEASAISMLRTGSTVNEVYRQRFGLYATDAGQWVLAGLIPSADGGTEIAGGPRGYDFVYVSDGFTYTVTASPETLGVDGHRSFFLDQSGVIRFSTGASAGVTDTPIQ